MTEIKKTFSGAHERHLLRKSNNPLFGKPQFTSEDLERARHYDQEELQQFTLEMQSAVMACLALGETAETDDILTLKETLEKLYERSCGLAGDLAIEQAAIQSVIHPIMTAIEKNAASDAKAMQVLYAEKTARTQHIELLKNKLLCDLLRPDTTIAESELTATLLSEPIDSMQVVLAFFSTPQISALKLDAQSLIADLKLSPEHPAHQNLAAIESFIESVY